MRHLAALALLLVGLAGSAWLEMRYAGAAWPNDWAAFCVDRAAKLAPDEQLSLEQGSARDRFVSHLAAARSILARLRSHPATDWTACTRTMRLDYVSAMAWHRFVRRAAPREEDLPPIDALQVQRAVDRLVRALQQAIDDDTAWFARVPTDSELAVRLAGRRLIDERPRLHPEGVVAMLKELATKAEASPRVPAHLGGATVHIGTGALAVWAALALLRRPTLSWALLTPMWLAGALVLVSYSLGAPAMRSIGVRHLQADLLWLPMLGALVGIAATLVARLDPGVAPWLIGVRDRKGILWRAGLFALLIGLVLWVPGASRRSECWLVLAAAGLGLIAARNAGFIALTGRPSAYGWPIVLVGSVGAAAVALVQGDRGSALLALALGGCWAIAYARSKLALPSSALACAAIVAWSAQVMPPAPPGMPAAERLAAQRDHCVRLHRVERFCTAATPETSEYSDVYRALAMARSGLRASTVGHGLADLPANGLAAARPSDRVLLQLPIDFAPALFVAAFGWAGLTGMLGYVLVLAWIASRTLTVHLAVIQAPAELLLRGTAGFMVLADAIRCLINLGGSLSALPLTGQPFVGLAHAPLATTVFFIALGICLVPPLPSSQGATP